MQKRNKRSSGNLNAGGSKENVSSSNVQEASDDGAIMNHLRSSNRSSFVMLTLCALIIYSSWSVYHYQFDGLPVPLSAEQAGKRGFSELESMKHVKALAQLGPHSVGSDALDHAVQVCFLRYDVYLLNCAAVTCQMLLLALNRFSYQAPMTGFVVNILVTIIHCGFR
ncbi:Formamidopyrimidine-DNA glycosylase [Bienertia sinuspersici]